MRFPVNHDLHCHPGLSFCSNDPEMTPEYILRHAEEAGYDVQCITDHFWSEMIPGANEFYGGQGLAHVSQSLPLPESDKVRFLFGCETEYCGEGKLGIAPEHYDQFSFIIIPPNHFHMEGFTRSPSCDTKEKVAELFTRRLEELCELDLPWKKVGIAHLTCGLVWMKGGYPEVFERMDPERLKPVFRKFAQLGAGIELNADCFLPGWREQEDAHLKLYRIARDEGCKFYCGSDAHHPANLDIAETMREVADALELTDKERYIVP